MNGHPDAMKFGRSGDRCSSEAGLLVLNDGFQASLERLT